MFEAWPFIASSIELSSDFPDQVVQAGAADAADVHAGALADGLEPFENGDVFCGVGSGHAGIDYTSVPRARPIATTNSS